MPSARPNFCSHCGADLDGAVNYCPQCGTQCRETTPAEPSGPSETTERTATTAASSEADSQEQFRRRVGDYLVDGWDIERDQGDRVMVRKREYGSVGAHAVLLLFTGGVGNLLYGWHKYKNAGERRILRADGDDTYGVGNDELQGTPSGSTTDTSASSALGYAGGAFSLFVGLVMLVSLEFLVMVLGMFFIAAALWMMPATRRRLQNRHPPTTFGHTQSTDETTALDTDKPCVVCSGSVDEGVERSYREEYVFAGIPLFTTASGENHYCRSCASGGISDFATDDDVTTETAVETEY